MKGEKSRKIKSLIDKKGANKTGEEDNKSE